VVRTHIIEPVELLPPREHATDGLDCWCGPRYYQLCSCDDDPGCWQCVDGLIPLTRDVASFTDPLIIIHPNVIPLPRPQ
jgi:hypothetical protein